MGLLTGKDWVSAKSFEAPTVVCSKCGSEGKTGKVRYSYFHALRIPFFPAGKELQSTCEGCGATLRGNGHSPEELESLKPFVGISWPPLYLFSGTVLVVIGIWFGIQQATADSRFQRSVLAAPAEGDLYILKEGTPPDFKIYRVVEVFSDSVYGRFAQSGHDTPAGCQRDIQVTRHLEDAYWRPTISTLGRVQLIEMHEQGNVGGVITAVE